MPIKLESLDGLTVLLDGAFALDTESIDTRRATMQIPGRVTIQAVDRRFAQTRRLQMTGTFQGLSPEDADELARTIRGYFAQGPVKLYRRDTDSRYIIVRLTRVSNDLHRGRFLGRLRTLSFDLEAADPFWYDTKLVNSVHSVSAVYERWDVTNPGSVPYQQIQVTFTARSGTVVNPSLHNAQGGFIVTYNGSLVAGESVILDGETRTATKGGVNVLSLINPQWQADGFPVQPGTNTLTFQDDPTSSHACDVSVQWRPAYW